MRRTKSCNLALRICSERGCLDGAMLGILQTMAVLCVVCITSPDVVVVNATNSSLVQLQNGSEESATMLEVTLEGESELCLGMRVDPVLSGNGSGHLIFKGLTPWREMVALHISKQNRLLESDIDFVMQLQAEVASSEGSGMLMRVLGLCVDVNDVMSKFWAVHSRYHEAGWPSVQVAITEWLEPTQHVEWNVFVGIRAEQLRAEGHTSDGVLGHLSGPALQLADGVAFLSSRGLLHGDMKSENVLVNLDTERVVICDIFELYSAEQDEAGISWPSESDPTCCERRPSRGLDGSLHCPPECYGSAFVVANCEAWSVGLMLLQALRAAVGLHPLVVWRNGHKISIQELNRSIQELNQHISALHRSGIQEAEAELRWPLEVMLDTVECALTVDPFLRCTLHELVARLSLIASTLLPLDRHFRWQAAGAGWGLPTPWQRLSDHDSAYAISAPRSIVAGQPAPLKVAAASAAQLLLVLQIREALRGRVVWAGELSLYQGMGVSWVVVGAEMLSEVRSSDGMHVCAVLLDQLGAVLHRHCAIAVHPRPVRPATLHWHRGPGAALAVWKADAIVSVQERLVVPQGRVLVVLPGTHVVVAAGVNIEVEGLLVVLGTEDEPCVLSAAGEHDIWGGLRVSGSARLLHTWMVEGGGDFASAFGHSDSQAVLMVNLGGHATMLGGGLVDNAGKAVGVAGGEVTLGGVVMMRCDMGLESVHGVVVMVGCDLSQLPNGQGLMLDDDNDAVRITGEHESARPSIIDCCRLSMGEDDGIDQDNAKLQVSHTRIEGFVNEGIAASGGGYVSVREVVISGCAQGLEVGYGGPVVHADSLLLLHNAVGIRYGCDYPTGHRGVLRLTRAVAVNNSDSDYVNAFPEAPHTRPWKVSMECSLVGAAQALLALEQWARCGGCGGAGAAWSAAVRGDHHACPHAAPTVRAGHGGVGLGKGRRSVFCDAVGGMVGRQLGVEVGVLLRCCSPASSLPLLHVSLAGLSHGETYSIAVKFRGEVVERREVEAKGGAAQVVMAVSASGGGDLEVGVQQESIGGVEVGAWREKVWLARYALGEAAPELLQLFPPSMLHGLTLRSLSHVVPASLQIPPGVPFSVRTPNDGWCGFRAAGTAESERGGVDGRERGAGTGVRVVVKAVGGDLGYHDSEDDTSELLAFCLDLALGGLGVVPPSRGVLLAEAEAERMLPSGEELEEERQVLVANSRCYMVRQNASHFRAALSAFVPRVSPAPPQLWQLLLNGSAARQPFPLSEDGEWPRNLLEYAALNFVGGCLRSDHNHHVLRGQRGAAWIALDNDRCFAPARIAAGAQGWAEHAGRLVQWRRLLFSRCDWPPRSAQRLLALALHFRTRWRSSLPAELRSCLAEIGGGRATEGSVLLEGLSDAAARLHALAQHLLRCGFPAHPSQPAPDA